MASGSVRLEAAGVTRRVGERTLFEDARLTLAAGERVGLGGASGSGKTQLLRALAQLDPLDAGEILWRGGPLADAQVPAFRAEVVYHQQSPALGPGSVAEALHRPFELAVHRGKRFEESRALELFERLGRGGELLTTDVADLSGGERQIVALVRVLLLDPHVLLLDEPTASLDAAAQERAVELLGQWVREPRRERAYLWVTHDRELRRRVAERSVEVAGGRLVDGSER